MKSYGFFGEEGGYSGFPEFIYALNGVGQIPF